MPTFMRAQSSSQKRPSSKKLRNPLASRSYKGRVRIAFLLLLAGVLGLSGCNSSSNNSQNVINLTGNWQYTTANPADQSFLGGLQGGYLQQNNGGQLNGSAVYAISLPGQSGGTPTVCNSGSAVITGSVNGQNVMLTAVAGTQTFTFTGTLNLTGTIVTGTYSSTAGTAGDGSPCGTAQTGLQWSAVSLPRLTGVFQGSFHSTGGNTNTGLSLGNQVFPVTATLMEGPNVGASSATVTGNLSFISPITQMNEYPCFDVASVNGQISGSNVTLQIIGVDGSNIGQIGGTINQNLGTVTYDSTSVGMVLHSLTGKAYAVTSSNCPGGGSISSPGDSGNLCLSLSATACQQPITITPGSLQFANQVLGSNPTTQKITITNSDPSLATINGLQLSFAVSDGSFGGPSDFNGLPNFSEQDNCASSPGASFSLTAAQSCTVNVSFTAQQSCPWLPYGSPASVFGAAPAACPLPLFAILTVISPLSADSDMNFSVPITGSGVSALQPSTAELDFSAEPISQASLPQILSFTNHSSFPVQILGPHSCLNNPPTVGNTILPLPLTEGSPVAGLQVVGNGTGSPGGNILAFSPSIIYSCDSDPTTQLPNFQITADTCTGNVIAPQATCGLQIAYVPQPSTPPGGTGLDFFLELNTVQCVYANGVITPPQSQSDCEIDSGRFPVELRANPPSPLRLSPAAGLDFGTVPLTNSSGKQKITIFNDPSDPNTATVTFSGKVVVKGDYSETDDCPFSLAPGASCTLTIGFKPKILGYDPGTITINYTPEPTQAPQMIFLRGTGQ
jgi:hypothetical protein